MITVNYCSHETHVPCHSAKSSVTPGENKAHQVPDVPGALMHIMQTTRLTCAYACQTTLHDGAYCDVLWMTGRLRV